MVMPSRRALRERFDDAASPHRAGLPWTHRRDYYLATDAAVGDFRVGVGAVAERSDGSAVGSWSARLPSVGNNDAELRALHFGLDRLAAHANDGHRVGILLDHDVLAGAVAAFCDRGHHHGGRPPFRTASRNHWGGITARIAALGDVRVAVVDSPANPAHELANQRCITARA